MSVCRRSDTGKWIVEFAYRHPDGRVEKVRQTSPVQTRRGAEHYELQLRQALLERDDGRRSPKKTPAFAAWAERFMAECAKPQNKVSEVESKQRILDNHLLPTFGKMPIDRIGRDEIKAYRTRKLKDGLSPKSVNNHITVLTRILGEAVESGLLEFVPRLKRLKMPPLKVDFLTAEEATALVEAAEGQWKVMIQLALTTGLRQGELLGLQWQDVNLDRRFLVVRRSIFRGRVGTPKSNKERVLPLNDGIVAALIAHKHGKGPWVFSGSGGDPLTDQQCKWPLWRACARSGLRQIGWHLLRHTFASHLVQAGVNILEVQRYLGHSDVRTTQRYAHLNPDVRHDAVEKLPSYSAPLPEGVVAIRKSKES